ncbi:replication-relaxation family protein [Streptomyces chrestomyceticus]|uniref:replication-relaxation family protein n=1 Tax=Streptomyces chrestomyceticus TaxID=68185 RepID=UPI0036C0C6BA
MTTSPRYRYGSTGPRRAEVLMALGIFQRATAEQVWKLTRPANRHDKLTRDALLDLQEHGMVRIEAKLEGNRNLWVLTRSGHREARSLLPKGVRLSSLRTENSGTGYDRHALAVTSTAAEMSKAGLGTLLSWQTEAGHKLPGGFVQYADLALRAPAAGVPVMLLEVDRLTESVDDLVHKLQRYTAWFELLAPKADPAEARQARYRGAEVHEFRLWRHVYPPTRREGYPPLAFVFADASETTMANTITRLEREGRRFWEGRPYASRSDGFTALDYHQRIPVVVTTLPLLRRHGAHAGVWRRLGRAGWQALTEALDNADGDRLHAEQLRLADQRRAAQREAERPVCARCGAKFTDERWQQTSPYSRQTGVGDQTLCGPCHQQDLERAKAEQEAAQAAAKAAQDAADAAARAAAEAENRKATRRFGLRRR